MLGHELSRLERVTGGGRNLDMFARLREQDDILVRNGFPPISDFWMERMRRFYRDRVPAGVYRAVDRVGRRGGKSTTWTRVAAVEGLWGDWHIPPGDMGQFHFFSVKLGYAEARLENLIAILTSLGFRQGEDFKEGRDRVGRFVRLNHRPVEWRATAANFRTAVSFTCVGVLYDELARWQDEHTGKNPATHVLESVRPALLTQLRHGAKEFMISSPWADLDAHYDHFELGNTDHQDVTQASSWEANPTITEADCRRLASEAAERGEYEYADFDREYRAIPMRGRPTAMFDPEAIDAAVRAGFYTPQPGDWLAAGGDFGFDRNSSAMFLQGIVTPHDELGAPLPTIHKPVDMLELRPAGTPLSPAQTVQQFADRLRIYGIESVMADKHYRQAIIENLAKHNLGFLDAPLDVPGVYVRARALLHAGRAWLPKNERFLRDLREVESQATASGRISVKLPKRADGSHADLVAAWALSCWQRQGTLLVAPVTHESGWTQEENDAAEQMERGPQEGWLTEREWITLH